MACMRGRGALALALSPSFQVAVDGLCSTWLRPSAAGAVHDRHAPVVGDWRPAFSPAFSSAALSASSGDSARELILLVAESTEAVDLDAAAFADVVVEDFFAPVVPAVFVVVVVFIKSMTS